tara:strand:- start:79 stop:462 length:384 start_codon:yes stop_codon:yes gene_type:complete
MDPDHSSMVDHGPQRRTSPRCAPERIWIARSSSFTVAGASIAIASEVELMTAHEAVLVLRGESIERLLTLKASISVDDPDAFSIKMDHEAVEMRITVQSDSMRTLRNTMDDILACIAAVEATLEQIE